MWKFSLKITCSLLLISATLCGYTEIKQYCPSCSQNKNSEAKDAAGAHLVYNGGPVMANVHVVDVLWGAGVNSQVAGSMPLFFKDLITSQWIDGLTEYNTRGQSTPTSNQVIGRGTFVGQFQITPFNTNTTVTDEEIQAEIAAQITAGNLPVPIYGIQGYANSLYVIEFPPGITITAQGATSCVQFCAYHNCFNYNGKLVTYAVQPDFGPTSGCGGAACGNGTELQNQQSVHSHEIAEAITDPTVGFNNLLGWYDQANGEIGDICDNLAQAEAAVTLNGHHYIVQKIWSNQQNACLAIIPPAVITIAPPVDFKGQVKTNKFPTYTDHIHLLTWKASSTKTVTKYLLYQDGKEIKTILAAAPYKVTLHNRDPKHTYVYTLAASDAQGNLSKLIKVTLP